LIVESQEHKQALEIKLSERANDARSEYQIIRWQKTRLCDAFVAGKHGLELSKEIAKNVVSYITELGTGKPDWSEFFDGNVLIDPTKEKWDPTAVCLFNKHDSDLGQALLSAVVACKPALDARVQSLDAWIEKHNALGSLGPVAGSKLPKELWGIEELMESKHPGNDAWAVGFKQNHKRSSCEVLPLQGCAQFFHAYDNQFVLYMCELEKFLEKGISSMDFLNWTDEPGGITFLKTSMYTIVLPKGASVFIPSGFWYGAIHVEVDKYIEHFAKPELSDSDNEEEDTKGKKQIKLTEGGIAHGISFPVFVKKWVDDMAPNVLHSIKTMNKPAFDKATKQLWKDRQATFKEVYGE